MASDIKGFGFEDDNVKYWDPDQSGKQNKSFPLIDSWEDVILYKKIKLYISELELRWFKINRRQPSTISECSNTLNWQIATQENKIENSIRTEVNNYWTEIRNLTIQSGLDVTLEMLPTDETPLQTGPTATNKNDRETVNQCQIAYNNIIKTINPIQEYFNKKYNMSIFCESTIKKICEIPDFVERIIEDDERQENKTLRAFVIALPMIDSATLALNMYGVSINTDTFINNMLEDCHRNRLEPEDPETTKWTSGYIDREGTLYTCADLDHVSFSKDICKHFNFKIKKDDDKDAQIVLDKKGWVKISMCRFFWDESKKLSDKQKSTIFSYMSGKKMEKALFNTVIPSYAKTLAEEFNQGEHE